MGKRAMDPSRIKLGQEGYQRVKARLFIEQDQECYYCLRKIYLRWQDTPDKETTINAQATIDHVVPISKGGTWKKYNIVLACRLCNRDKADLSEEDFHEVVMKRISSTKEGS